MASTLKRTNFPPLKGKPHPVGTAMPVQKSALLGKNCGR